jgi:hypothetical protein
VHKEEVVETRNIEEDGFIIQEELCEQTELLAE